MKVEHKKARIGIWREFGIRCPECNSNLSRTVDSRPQMGAQRRRRECPNGHRYTTYETIKPEEPIFFDI